MFCPLRKSKKVSAHGLLSQDINIEKKNPTGFGVSNSQRTQKTETAKSEVFYRNGCLTKHLYWSVALLEI